MNEIQPSSSFYSVPRGVPAEPAMTAHDLALIAWRRLWLIVLIVAASTLTAAIISARSPKEWQATAQVLLVQREPMTIATTQAAASAPMVESIDTQITLLQSRELAQEASAKLGISPETLQNAATITARKDGDNVIDLAVVADSRQHAIHWANTLCRAFVAYKTALAQKNSKENLAQLEIQTAQAQKQAAAADAKLLAFEQSHRLGGVGVLDPQTQKTAALNALAAQNAVVAGLQNDNVAAQATAAADLAQLNQGKAAITKTHTVRDDSQVIKLQESLGDLERKRFETAQRYKAKVGGPGERLLSDLDGQIASTQANLNQALQTLETQPSLQSQGALQEASDNAQSAARSAQVKLAGAIAQRDLLQRQTLDLPRLSQDAQNLIDSQTQAHNLYDAASAAVQAAQINKNVASGNVQIVQPAFAPAAPFRPNPKHDLLVGFGIGLVLALLAVLLLEQTDSSVRTAADVRRLVDGPVVAVLPQMTRAEKNQFAGGRRPPHLLETYNAARANLGLAMRQRAGVNLDDHQVILVTSALPGEGKSLTASELAHSFARAGRRVVLVNADMRRPSALMQTGKTSAPGLAEILSGELRVEDALVPTETAHLSILPGGNAVQNPMDLISQPHMAETMQALREAADVVIVDSPPAAVVADALLLAPHVDCILYVIGVGMVGSDTMRNTAGALAAAAPKMLAYFVNRVPHLIGEPANYSYAGYGRTTFAPPPPAPEKTSRVYSSTRTIVMKRYSDPGMAEKADALEPDPGSGLSVSKDGVSSTRSSLRVLPRVGSSLITLEGPYTGQSFALSPAKSLSLGSRPDSDIVLARDATISQAHARIAPENEGFVVYDVSSTNGTFVNDIAVSRHALEVGDVLHLGASKFRYE